MEFNQEKNVFVMTPEERMLFRLPADTAEWPHADSGVLLERIGLVELDLTDVNPTALPPTDRRYMVAETARRAQLARQARHQIARYATLAETDFERLLESDS